jgi:ABC-type Fe3+ transport system substrate-binding protein
MKRAWSTLCTVIVTLSTVALALLMACLAMAQSSPSKDWKAEWDRTVVAAKKEGVLVAAVATGNVWRNEIARFHDAYPEIKLEMSTFSGRDFWPRFIKERDAGQYLWDIRVGGTDAQEFQLKDAGHMQSVRDLLVLPEVLDDNVWYGGIDSLFLDKERTYFIGFVTVEAPPAYFNTRLVGDTLTIDDLVDPKWMGKISMADLRGGAGVTSLGGLLKQHGEDFIRKLLVDQKPVITNIPRQQLDWLVSGRYPIAFGLPNATPVDYRRNGGDVSMIKNVTGLRQWAVSTGALTVPTKNPHPAATKLFVNWILTRDEQARLMKGVELNSRRKDVAIVMPEYAVDYDRMGEYYGQQSEEMMPYVRKVQALVRELEPH